MIFSGFRIRRAICRFLTAGMFFAQAIGIANACIEAAPSPAMAFTQNDHDGDCGKTVNQNACLQQCNAGDQSTSQAQVAVAAMPDMAVLTVPVAIDIRTCAAVTLVSFAHSHDPPPSIRFCSFQL